MSSQHSYEQNLVGLPTIVRVRSSFSLMSDMDELESSALQDVFLDELGGEEESSLSPFAADFHPSATGSGFVPFDPSVELPPSTRSSVRGTQFEVPADFIALQNMCRSMVDISEVRAFLAQENIRSAFPSYLIRKLLTESTRRISFGREYRQIDQTSRRRDVPEVVRRGHAHQRYDHLSDVSVRHQPRDVSGLRENSFWKVPDEAFVRFDAPLTVANWTPRNGRRWVLTRAEALRVDGPRNYTVLGNSAAQHLYMISNDFIPHVAVLREWIASAQLYYGNMNDTTVRAPTGFQLCDHPTLAALFAPTLAYGDRTIRTLSELELVKSDFRRDKPAYKAAERYLSGEKIDVSLLRQTFSRVAARNRCIGGVSVGAEKVSSPLVIERFEPLLGPVLVAEAKEALSVGSSAREVQRRIDAAVPRDEIREDFVRILPQAGEEWTVGTVLGEIQAAFPQLDLTLCSRIAALFFALWQQTSVLGALGCIGQFALHFPRELRDQYELLALGAIGVIPQGDRPPVSFLSWDFFQEATTGLGAQLWELLASILVVLVGQEVFPVNWKTLTGFSLVAFAQEVRVQCSRLAVKSVAESLAVAVTRIVTLVRACVAARSLEPLWAGMTPVQWCADVQALVTYYPELIQCEGGISDDSRFRELLRGGLLPTGVYEQMTPPEMREFVDQLFRVGTSLSRAFAGVSLSRDIDHCMQLVRQFQAANSTSFSVMASRVQPFGVFLYGPPGSGKTNLSRELMRVIGRANGYPTDATASFTWQMNVNFQDGLSHIQWCVLFDDVDQNVAPPTGMTDNHYTSVLKVVNNAPFPVEQSDVTLKGKICAKPLLAMYCSNFMGARLRGYSLADEAFWRRLPYYLVVRAREGFEKSPGSGILDPDKVVPGADFLSISVLKYSAASKAEPPYVTVLSEVSKSEAFLYLVGEYRAHLAREKMFIARGMACEFCPRCYADSVGGDCQCLLLSLQSMGEEYAAYVLTAGALVAGAVALVPPARRALASVAEAARLVGEAARDSVEIVRDVVGQYRYVAEIVSLRYRRAMSFVPPLVAMALMGAVALGVRAVVSRIQVVQQARADNLVPTHVPRGWVRAPQEYTPGMPDFRAPSWSRPEVEAAVRESYVTVVGIGESINTVVYGVCVGHGAILTVLHVLPPLGGFVEVRHQGITHQVQVTELTTRVLGADLVLVKAPGLAGVSSVFKRLWYQVDGTLSQFDAVALVYPDRVEDAGKNSVVLLGPGERRLATDLVTEVGTCGLLYIAQIGSGWKVVALHHARVESFRGVVGTHGLVLTQHGVDAALRTLATTPQSVVIPRLQCSVLPDQGFTHYPEKSEFWTAVSQYGVQGRAIGYALPNVHGATMKSRVRPTIFAEDFRDLEEAWCGERGYWRPPDFRGRMVDGKWSSPYISSLLPLHRGPRQDVYYWLAVADYVLPFFQLDCEGYRSISPEEAVVGLPGTVIQSVDLNTSVGMPYNQRKRNFMMVTEGSAFVDERVLASFAEMKAILDAGDLPAPVVVGMLKDEQLKPGKEPRVFNCAPFAYNWLLKTEFAGVAAFERANCLTMESFVGINMTSSECNEVVDHLLSRDPFLTRLLDMDVTKQDKSEDGVVLDFVSLVDGAKASAIGLDPYRVYSLNHADRNAVSIFKNDFFMMGAQNPSGGGRTVEKNSVVNSLQQRYMYFRMKYPEVPEDVSRGVLRYSSSFFDHWGRDDTLSPYCTFRADCALATYGDDALLAVSSGCGFYDPSRVVSLAREIGMVYTDARKSSDISWKNIGEVQFLRRAFVWDVECARYVAQLSLKSLAKMLVLAGPSSLTRSDHAASLLADVLREAVYYGREFYEEVHARVVATSVKYGIDVNSYLVAPPYEVYRQKMVAGGFSTWRRVGYLDEDE